MQHMPCINLNTHLILCSSSISRTVVVKTSFLNITSRVKQDPLLTEPAFTCDVITFILEGKRVLQVSLSQGESPDKILTVLRRALSF